MTPKAQPGPSDRYSRRKVSKPTAWKHDNSLQPCRRERKHRPAQILAGQLPHAIELLLHVSPVRAPPGQLGKVNGASVRKRSATAATSRPSRPKERGGKKLLPQLRRGPPGSSEGRKSSEAASRPPSLPERAQPVWEEGGSASTSLLRAAPPRRLTCDTSAQPLAV